MHLIPAPGALASSQLEPKKPLMIMADINNCYTSARGCTATLGNFAKATFNALSKSYSHLTPNPWRETVHPVSLSGLH